jgi:hypothetical protein
MALAKEDALDTYMMALAKEDALDTLQKCWEEFTRIPCQEFGEEMYDPVEVDGICEILNFFAGWTLMDGEIVYDDGRSIETFEDMLSYTLSEVEA